MSDTIAALDRDHANVARLLELLESEILAIEVGKTPDYPLLQDIMRYMTQYPDRFHHPKEDLIFVQLLKREPGARADRVLAHRHHVRPRRQHRAPEGANRGPGRGLLTRCRI